MAVREIKTTLTLDGEKQFEQEIKSAASNLRVMSSEMRAASAEYGTTGDKATYLAKKSQTLKTQLAQQKEIFEALGKAVESSAQSTGEASSKTDGYRIRMNNAAAAVAKLERELRDTDKELEELGQDSETVGRQLREGIGDAAEDTAKDLKGMYAALKEDIGSIKSSSAVTAVTDIAGAVTGAAGSLMDFADSSREYNRQMSYLETNASKAELNLGKVKGILTEVASVTGDVDGAFEGVSNLIATGFDTSEMELAIQTLGGAVVAFPETMKFENLAESLQESIATGEATGAFAEIIERTGGSLDDFKAAMKAARTEEDRQRVALSFLHNTGLSPVYQDYKDVNSELINAEASSLKLSSAWQTLGGTIDTYLTPMREKIAGLLEAANLYLTEGINAGALKVQEVLGTGYNEEELEAAAEASRTLREEYDALQEEILEAYAAGDGVRAWEIQARINELQAQIAQEEAEAMTKAGQAAETAAEESGEAAGEAMTEATTQAINDGADDMKDAAETAVSNAIIGATNEVNERGAEMNAAWAAQVNEFNATSSMLRTPSLGGTSLDYYSTPSSGNGGGRNVNAAPTMQISLNVDGKKVASVMTPQVSNMQSTSAGRAAVLYG